MIEIEEEEIMMTDEVVAIAIDQDPNTMTGDEMEAVTVCPSFLFVLLQTIHFRWWPWRWQRSRWR